MDVREALRSRAVTAALFLELMLDEADGGPLRAFGGKGAYVDPEGRLWLGTYGLGRLSPVQTSEGVAASAFTVGFDVSRDPATEESFEALVTAIRADRNIRVKGRRVRAQLGVFDRHTGALVGGRFVQWASGVGSHLTTHWSPDGIGMTLHCEPLIGGIWPSKGRMLNHEDQQLLYPDDMGLEFQAIIAAGGRNVVWNPGD